MTNWKESFLQELKEISIKKHIKDYRAFIFWYIKMTEDKPDDEILEIITDGSEDAGSDAVIIDHNLKIIKIIQSKYSSSIGESSFNKDELNKLNKVYDYLSGEADYYSLREYIHQKLKDKLDKAIRFVKEEGYEVRLYFITTHKLNENSKLYENQGVYLDILGSKEIERKYEEWRHGHTPELGLIEIPYLDILNGPENPRAFLANIATESLRKQYLLHKNKLFSRNVRIFYGDKQKPNKAMKKTLNESPQNFWYFNNGITILSEKINIDNENKKIILKNPQIINGCQTISTIGEDKPNNKSILSAKIVEIGDSLLNQYLIDGIIESNNRQTTVDERMLKSNHPLQVTLQRQLEPLNFYYERKEGQYQEERAKQHKIGRMEKIKNIDLIRANVSVIKSSHLAHSDENDLFSTHFGDVFKDEKSYLDYLIPYLIWREIERISKYYRGDNRKRFHKLAAFHIVKAIYDNCNQLNNNLKMNAIYKMLNKIDPYDNFEFNKKPIQRLLDHAWEKFKKSKFAEKDSGQRDFFKSKDTYVSIFANTPNQLKRELSKLFD